MESDSCRGINNSISGSEVIVTGRSEQKRKKMNMSYLENADENLAGLMRENTGLDAAIDILTTKLANQEASLREKASQYSAIIAASEQRARHAEERLRIIEGSVSWKAVSSISNRLRRYPRLKVFIKRVLKAATWTATGQITSKIGQYREARKYQSQTINSSAREAATYESFGVYPTTLPPDLLTNVISFMKLNGPIKLIVAVNFYAEGGAESAALEYAMSYARINNKNSVLFVMTDNHPRRPLPVLPDNIFIIDLNNFDDSSSSKVRESYLYLLIRSTPLETLHIVNSVAAYNLLLRMPSAFLDDINVIASVYALQFDPLDRTKIIGYGKDFLPGNIDKIDCVVTDNRRFALEGPLKLGLSNSAQKFKTVYNKSKLSNKITIADSLRLMNERISYTSSSGRLKIVWAGRPDREKRVDLLIEVARLTEEFCDFLIYGGAVIDGGYEDQLKNLPNVLLLGPYRSPIEWDTPIKGNVFLFTSVWEGMPNTLIEAAYMGYPIVASNVGGVGELITPQTGWALDRYADANSFAEVLAEIFNNATEAKQRTACLIELVHSRHNEDAYLSSLSTVPGYSKVN